MIKFVFKARPTKGKVSSAYLKTKGSVVDLAAESSMLLNMVYYELSKKDPILAQKYKELIEHGIASNLTWRISKSEVTNK